MHEYTLKEKIIMFFKQLFCRHPWFDIEEWEGWQTCQCVKCGKIYQFQIKQNNSFWGKSESETISELYKIVDKRILDNIAREMLRPYK